MKPDPELAEHLWWRSKGARSFPKRNGDPASGAPDLAAELHRMRRELGERHSGPAIMRNSGPRSRGPARLLDLNRATIDELWSAGLTRTQAMRVVAQRARQDGFHSLEDLDGLPGFPAGLIASLKQRVTL